MTRGHVILAGPATFHSIPDFARAERTIVELRSGAPTGGHARPFRRPHRLYRRRAAGLAAYARLIGHWDITRLPYDGEADRWFDPAWLTAG